MQDKIFLFVGNRLEVLNALLKLGLNVYILLEKDCFATRALEGKQRFQTFHSKAQLLALIQSHHFDILVSNGCPYILPVSKLKKPHQIFINCHPSLLPNLKGAHPINGALLFNQPSGASCHIMHDEVDSGEIIAQVPVYNNPNTPLPLLYQMCFLAEKQAFLESLARDFVPMHPQPTHAPIPYFTRQSSDMELDFSTHSTRHIIQTIKAFSARSQRARIIYEGEHFYFTDALLVENAFLSEQFAARAINDICLRYENAILCKRAEGFLQLSGGGEMNNFHKLPDSLNHSSLRNHTQDFYTTLKSQTSHTALIEKENLNNSMDYKTPIFTTRAYLSSLEPLDSRHFYFTYKEGDSIFYNAAIMENLPALPFHNAHHSHNASYDMSSPYGYGGYISNSTDEAFLSRALQKQSLEAQKRGIIAEFVRFHPLLNARKFTPLLDMFACEREVVEVSSEYTLRWESYSSRLRGKLRKSLELLEVRQSLDIEAFYRIYIDTMKRNNADEFYFFNLDYLRALLALPHSLLLEARYNNEVCAMGIFLFDCLCGYYHLGANTSITLDKNLNAMGALFEHFFQIAHTKGIKSCLLGGGRSNQSTDSLFLFKKQFATFLKPFYIGGKIYNQSAYDALRVQNNTNPYFLSYRFANLDSSTRVSADFAGGGS